MCPLVIDANALNLSSHLKDFVKRNLTKNMGPFGKRLLVMLFKCCGNTGGLKSVKKICVVLFKHRRQKHSIFMGTKK